jgi:hypothetical protein
MDVNLAVSSYAIFNPLSHMSRRDVLDNLAGSSYVIFNPFSHLSRRDVQWVWKVYAARKVYAATLV